LPTALKPFAAYTKFRESIVSVFSIHLIGVRLSLKYAEDITYTSSETRRSNSIGRDVLKKFPKTHLVFIGVAATIVGALISTGSSQEAEANRITIELPVVMEKHTVDSENQTKLELETPSLKDRVNDALILPAQTELLPATAEQIPEEQPVTEAFSQSVAYTVKNGDTLSSIFSRAGYGDKLIYKLFSDDQKNKQLASIHPGQTISFDRKDAEQPTRIKLQLNKLESIIVSRGDGGRYGFEKEAIVPETRTAYAAGQIDSSLFLAGKNAGLDETVIMALANIFGWDIDFSLDIRSGDKFSLIYEEQYLDGAKIGNGRIMAANFTNQNQIYQAVLYTDGDGRSNYFTPTGQSLRKEFLRSPVEFARVSSHFNLNRKHPVLHKIRAHKGTDYAASTGTPIRATGDGTVVHSGRKGGYGKAVIIKHGQQFTTLYAHLSKYGKGIYSGARINQGQIIGYVGSTGLASGPHLHYEFRVNGIHKNPLTVSLPQTDHIAKSEMDNFRSATQNILGQLDTFERSYQVALRP
jgi:murein DD-endopeptidase MepM/ murein hydrolase activator NlpD